MKQTHFYSIMDQQTPRVDGKRWLLLLHRMLFAGTQQTNQILWGKQNARAAKPWNRFPGEVTGFSSLYIIKPPQDKTLSTVKTRLKNTTSSSPLQPLTWYWLCHTCLSMRCWLPVLVLLVASGLGYGKEIPCWLTCTGFTSHSQQDRWSAILSF